MAMRGKKRKKGLEHGGTKKSLRKMRRGGRKSKRVSKRSSRRR